MSRYSRRQENKRVSFQQCIPELLLVPSRRCRRQPIRVWDVFRFDDMYLPWILYTRGCQVMRRCVQDPKPLVNGDLETGRRRIERRVDDVEPGHVPAPADAKRAFPRKPAPAVARLIDPPESNLAGSERWRQGVQV